MQNDAAAVTVPYERLRYAKRMAKREISDALREHICGLVAKWADAGESNAEIARTLGVERATVGAIRNEGVAALRAGTKLAFHEQRGRLAASLGETIQLARARYDRVSDRLPAEVSTAPDEARTGVRADVAGGANQSNDDALEVDEEAAPKAKKKHG